MNYVQKGFFCFEIQCSLRKWCLMFSVWPGTEVSKDNFHSWWDAACCINPNRFLLLRNKNYPRANCEIISNEAFVSLQDQKQGGNLWKDHLIWKSIQLPCLFSHIRKIRPKRKRWLVGEAVDLLGPSLPPSLLPLYCMLTAGENLGYLWNPCFPSMLLLERKF